ncbi:unnamed protein product [Knipowitschia caucasica]|uniref:Fibroblast growth factor n=1 Tax=Knipowitschia caucasica TaxID=637954 RepID=A0AAV2KKH0_KNICA
MLCESVALLPLLCLLLSPEEGLGAPVGGPGAEALGWTEVVRHRHLFAARSGLYLTISSKGRVRGSEGQSPDSLLEMTPVSSGCVALRGVTSELFLCLQQDATVYTSVWFSPECVFVEQLQEDGYSVYSSLRHGTLLTLTRPRDRGAPPHARFLPRVSSVEARPWLLPSDTPHPLPSDTPRPLRSDTPPVELDLLDAFKNLSPIIHSPSFHQR